MQEYNEDIVVEQLQNPATVRQAFAQVVARYSQPLYWQIRKMVLSHDDANDLLQNTFLKAWGSIEYFRDVGDHGYLGGGLESLVSPCRPEDRKIFARAHLI